MDETLERFMKLTEEQKRVVMAKFLAYNWSDELYADLDDVMDQEDFE